MMRRQPWTLTRPIDNSYTKMRPVKFFCWHVPDCQYSGVACSQNYMWSNANFRFLSHWLIANKVTWSSHYCSGFGNAAGLLAQYGLMGGQRSSAQAQYSDDSDSETEEYKELEPNINPVTGKWRLVEIGGCLYCSAHSVHCMPINSWADALGVYVRLEVFCTLI